MQVVKLFRPDRERQLEALLLLLRSVVAATPGGEGSAHRVGDGLTGQDVEQSPRSARRDEDK